MDTVESVGAHGFHIRRNRFHDCLDNMHAAQAISVGRATGYPRDNIPPIASGCGCPRRDVVVELPDLVGHVPNS
jgi:hypothetical protein